MFLHLGQSRAPEHMMTCLCLDPLSDAFCSCYVPHVNHPGSAQHAAACCHTLQLAPRLKGCARSHTSHAGVLQPAWGWHAAAAMSFHELPGITGGWYVAQQKPQAELHHLQIEEDTDRDRYMSPLEAKRYGIIDHIIGGDEAGFAIKGSTHDFPKTKEEYVNWVSGSRNSCVCRLLGAASSRRDVHHQALVGDLLILAHCELKAPHAAG